jgi:hypothetical protein
VAISGPPNTYAIIDTVPFENYGMAAGTIAAFRRSGNQLPVAVPMMAFFIVLDDVALANVAAPEFLTSLRSIFGIFLPHSGIGVNSSFMQ